MDTKTLMENLIAAIEAIPSDALPHAHARFTIEEAKETAGLAKLILPSLSQPAAPAGAYFIDAEDGYNIGPFATEQEADEAIDRLDKAGTGYTFGIMQAISEKEWLGRQPQPVGPVPPGTPANPAPGSLGGTNYTPQRLPDGTYEPCPNCGHKQDAGGCAFGCFNPMVQSGTPSVGSVIANKPPGSLYKT